MGPEGRRRYLKTWKNTRSLTPSGYLISSNSKCCGLKESFTEYLYHLSGFQASVHSTVLFKNSKCSKIQYVTYRPLPIYEIGLSDHVYSDHWNIDYPYLLYTPVVAAVVDRIPAVVAHSLVVVVDRIPGVAAVVATSLFHNFNHKILFLSMSYVFSLALATYWINGCIVWGAVSIFIIEKW